MKIIRSKLADWITIVTGPITIATAVASLMGRIGFVRGLYQMVPSMVILYLSSTGLFFFFAQLRLGIRYARSYDHYDGMRALILIGTNITALAFLIALDLAILPSLFSIPPPPNDPISPSKPNDLAVSLIFFPHVLIWAAGSVLQLFVDVD